MQQLLLQPTPQELAALNRIAQTHDGQQLLAFMARTAQAYIEASTTAESDAKSRQAQGAWKALTSFVDTAKAQAG